MIRQNGMTIVDTDGDSLEIRPDPFTDCKDTDTEGPYLKFEIDGYAVLVDRADAAGLVEFLTHWMEVT